MGPGRQRSLHRKICIHPKQSTCGALYVLLQFCLNFYNEILTLQLPFLCHKSGLTRRKSMFSRRMNDILAFLVEHHLTRE